MADRHTARGHWLADAGPVEPAPALDGDERADILIVGGGYTGLWTAWHLKALEPEARVVLCEAAVCGHGPSGRNGGFCNALWFGIAAMRKRFGDRAAIAIARAARDSVRTIGEFCVAEGVDADYRAGGYLRVSTAPAWDAAWEPTVAACAELGEPDECIPLDAEDVAGRCRSPVFRGGALYPTAATVQPAKLALGLRERVRERGVELYERTALTEVATRSGEVVARGPTGRIRARRAVMATGAMLVGLPQLRRRLTLTSSHMVITEPVPDVLEDIGWTGGECITDARAMVHYFRTTRDGRVAFGWGGGRVVLGSRLGRRAEVDPFVTEQVERDLLRFFPGLEGRRIEHAWGGPIDVSPTHLPVIAELEPRIHCAYGYTGHGVGPSQMVARSLASLALDRRDGASRLAFVSPEPVRVPPEPLRFVGGTLIRRALVAKETAEEHGERAGPITRFVAGIPERIGIQIGR